MNSGEPRCHLLLRGRGVSEDLMECALRPRANQRRTPRIYIMLDFLYLLFTFRGFDRRFYPQRLTTIPSQIHTLTLSQPRRATASSSGAVRMRRLAQGHLNTRWEEPGIELATFRLTVSPLYLPSHCHPCSIATAYLHMQMYKNTGI